MNNLAVQMVFSLVLQRYFLASLTVLLVNCRAAECEGWVPMKAYNLVLGRLCFSRLPFVLHYMSVRGIRVPTQRVYRLSDNRRFSSDGMLNNSRSSEYPQSHCFVHALSANFCTLSRDQLSCSRYGSHTVAAYTLHGDKLKTCTTVSRFCCRHVGSSACRLDQ